MALYKSFNLWSMTTKTHPWSTFSMKPTIPTSFPEVTCTTSCSSNVASLLAFAFFRRHISLPVPHEIAAFPTPYMDDWCSSLERCSNTSHSSRHLASGWHVRHTHTFRSGVCIPWIVFQLDPNVSAMCRCISLRSS